MIIYYLLSVIHYLVSKEFKFQYEIKLNIYSGTKKKIKFKELTEHLVKGWRVTEN